MTRTIIYVFAAIWLAFVLASVLAFTAPPQGDGFLRGFNRLEGFLTWQFAAFGAGMVGVTALRLTPAPHSRTLTLLGYGPITISALVALCVAGVVAWAAFSPSPAAPADALPPTTTPPPRS